MPEPTSTSSRRLSPEGREQTRSPASRPDIQTRGYNFMRGQSHKIRRKKILNQERRTRPMQEKGQRRQTKHINNFSELSSTNIRRSTS